MLALLPLAAPTAAQNAASQSTQSVPKEADPARAVETPFKGPSTTPTAEQPAPSTWSTLNRLELAVNDDAFTRARLRAGRPGNQASPEQMKQELERLTGDMLMAQAGQDLGFEPDMIQAMVQGELDRRQEVAGTAARLSDELATKRWTSTSYVEDAKSYIYRTLFVRSVTGRDAGPLGRAYVDRYVRPGRLWLETQIAKERPIFVTLRAMQFHLGRYDSKEDAADAANAMLVRLRAGEDFGRLAEEYELCEPGTGGLQKRVRLEELATKIPTFHAFASSAKNGDLSAPLEWGVDGRLNALIVLQMVEKTGGAPGPFEDPRLQQDLRERIQERLDDFHVVEAMERLFRSAHIDPKPKAVPAGSR